MKINSVEQVHLERPTQLNSQQEGGKEKGREWRREWGGGTETERDRERISTLRPSPKVIKLNLRNGKYLYPSTLS